MDDGQRAAFFGGQYYFAFDFSRPDVLYYYRPMSGIDFNGYVVQGLNGISFLYNADFLIGVSHLVTEMSSFVEPISNRRILTFRGVIRMEGQLSDFKETFITEGELIHLRHGWIVYSIFRSAPRQEAVPYPMPDELDLALFPQPQAPMDHAQAPMDHAQIAAFFGGQYYFAFDSSRQYVPRYYGPTSRIDFDGRIAQGLEAIGLMYNANFLNGVTHLVTTMSSYVEPITNYWIITFGGIIRTGDQVREFKEMFMMEGQLIPPRNGRIVESIFRSSPRPRQEALQYPMPYVAELGALYPQPQLQLQAPMDHVQMVAFFGGQYYFAFDSSRQYVLQYYGPTSIIDFNGHIAQGLEAIGFVYNTNFFNGVTHLVTEMSSFVDPITNRRFFTFRGIIHMGGMGGQLIDFQESFITEGQLIPPRNGQIVYSRFHSVPRQEVLPYLDGPELAALYQPQALINHSQMAAFFGGQYYFTFDSSRPYLLLYYGPMSSIDFDGRVVQGREGISFMYDADRLIGVTHLVTNMSSFVEPITNRWIITFGGIIHISGEVRDFHEVFITEGQLIHPRNGRIVHSIFRSAPRQEALAYPMPDVPIVPASQGFSADPMSADEADVPQQDPMPDVSMLSASQGFSADPMSRADVADVAASSHGSNEPDAADVVASSHGSNAPDA